MHQQQPQSVLGHHGKSALTFGLVEPWVVKVVTTLALYYMDGNFLFWAYLLIRYGHGNKPKPIKLYYLEIWSLRF